ncbi:glycosyltransferase family 2 protein [Chloroflexales bacterium ZM16-3]|nr:glycosyltransferase family 2 protein [Chloroflexales bacterium ZM16-3]
MSDHTPVILLVYRRPAEMAKVRAALRAARPDRLIIVADGPRADRPGDAEAVAAARAAAEAVDWPCEITRIYADSNMGLRSRVESGITAAFTRIERAIILEDDCVPAPSFFRFCAELLDRYADDERVMAISGDDFQGGRAAAASYRFSRYPHCWGWATWRRSWQRYDGPMADWPALRVSGWLERSLNDRRAARYWRAVFDRVYAGQIDSWAYRWTYSCWRQNGLTALPARNLVSNIGFGTGATHTNAPDNPFAALNAYDLPFPLRHPPNVVADTQADAHTQSTLYDPSLARRLAWRIVRTMRRRREKESVERRDAAT